MSKLLIVLKRFESKGVLIGMLGIIIAVSGVTPENITSWPSLWDSFINIISNPFIIFSIALQIYAFLNNPTDKEKF